MSRAKKQPKIDPRLADVIRTLDEVSDYNATHDVALTMGAVMQRIVAAVEWDMLAFETMGKVLTALFLDPESPTGDEERIRDAIVAVADAAHREICSCCARRHTEAA